MKKYEAQMTHYVVDGDTLKPIEPDLQPGQKKLSHFSKTNLLFMQMSTSLQHGELSCLPSERHH
jgi:hypothetical protein